MHQLGQEVEHEGGLAFAGVLQSGISFQQIFHVDGRQIEDHRFRLGGQRHEERFQVSFRALRRDQDELLDAVVLPLRQQLIDGSVQGLPRKAAGPGELTCLGKPNAVLEGRGPQDARSGRGRIRYRAGNVEVGAQWQVRASVVQGPHRQEQSGIPGQYALYLRPGHPLQRCRLSGRLR